VEFDIGFHMDLLVENKKIIDKTGRKTNGNTSKQALIYSNQPS